MINCWFQTLPLTGKVRKKEEGGRRKAEGGRRKAEAEGGKQRQKAVGGRKKITGPHDCKTARH
jgi:hypothetical protein